MTREALTETHLEEVAEEIWSGRCVAFVGAGFSAAAGLPGWVELLEAAARLVPVDAPNRDAIAATVAKGRKAATRELEAAGQLIQDALGAEAFRNAVSGALALGGRPLPERYVRRRENLKQIPFRAILTTNFDPLLPGMPPTPEAYRRVLREHALGPWHPRYWPGGAGPDVLQLHGAVATDHLVFARRDYRELLFANPGYLTFLRALFATRTLLFIGFSFRDAYVDLLRAELLQLVERPGVRTSGPPRLSYALMTDLSEAEAAYYREHEGMRVLCFERGADYDGFDRLLDRLAERTNPVRRLGERLRRSRVLWVDPYPENNRVAAVLLRSGSETPFRTATTLDEARALLGSEAWDLLISHWGHQPDGPSRAEALLDWMHDARVRVPVVIFSSPDFFDENRRAALAAGACDLTCTWGGLFQAVDRVLCPAGTRGVQLPGAAVTR